MEYLTEASGIARASFADGANAFQQISSKLENLANAGQFLKQSIENKTVDAAKLTDLWEAVGEMSKKVNESFEQLNAAAASVAFYQEAADVSDNLIQMFEGVLMNPTVDSLEYFKNSYDTNSPIETAYKTMSLLVKPSTNPMRNGSTGKDWETVFTRIFAHFLYLESIANGMYQSKNLYSPSALKRRIELFNVKLDEWKEEIPNPLWTSMALRIVQTVQKESTSNDEKVTVLEKTLKKTFPKETFLILAYNDCDGAQNHVLLGPPALAVQSLHLGGSNIVVVRSAKWKTLGDGDKESFRARVRNYTGVTWQNDYTAFVTSLRGSPDVGFVALVSETQNLAVGSLDDAPGGLTRIRVEKESFSGVGLGKTFTLFVGHA